MAEADTQGAISAAVYDFLTAGSPSVAAADIAWENIHFDPAGKAVWARVSFVPNQPGVITLGSRGLDRGNGFFQIDLNIPTGTGDAVLRAWYDAARAYFIAGRVFTQSAQSVVILSCGETPGRVVDNWYRKSITVFYRSDFQRNLIP